MIPLSDDIRSRSTPYVTIAIIVACVVVFVRQMAEPSFTEQMAFRPVYLLSSAFLDVGFWHVLQAMLLSVFMHGGLLHIAGNMLFLWVFGDNVEDRMGHLKYLLFYLAAGVAATLAHSLTAVLGLFTNPHALDTPIVGASGAIAGVLGAYLVLVPGSNIRTLVIFIFITIINIPAPFFIVMWFILQLFSGIGALAGGPTGVAYWAHIGGFLLGYYVAKGMVRRRRPPQPRIIYLDADDL